MVFINTVTAGYSALQCLWWREQDSVQANPWTKSWFRHHKTCRAVNQRTVLNQPFKGIIKITLLYQYCIVRKLYGKDNFKCLMPLDEDTTDNAAKAYEYASCCNYSVCIHIHSATTYQPFKVLCQIFYI